MTILIASIAELLHLGLVLAAALLLPTLVRLLAARLAGLQGPPLAAAWRDLIRLFRKERVQAENLSVFAAAAPTVRLGLLLTAACLVPTFAVEMVFSPLADLLTVAGLLAAERLVAALSAIDAGSAAGGLAARRIIGPRHWAEPALLLAILALALPGAGTQFGSIIRLQHDGMLLPGAPTALASAALALLAFLFGSETEPDAAREYAGPDLALLSLADGLRLVVWANVLGALTVPVGLAAERPSGWLTGMLAWLAWILAVATVVAVARVWLGGLGQAGRRLGGVALLLAGLAAVTALAGPAAP